MLNVLMEINKSVTELATDYGEIINYLIDAVASDVKRKEILNVAIKKLGNIQ